MKSTIKAVILDLDGVIISSKVAEYESWRRVFQVLNCKLTLSKWIRIIDNPRGEFDPARIVIKECAYGNELDIHNIRTLRYNLYEALRKTLTPLPGVMKLIKECTERGLLLGLASNGLHEKIDYYLARLKIMNSFKSIKCRDDVKNTKPEPDLYLEVLKDLSIKSSEAIAFEDSPPGITAAKAAHLYCIAVPNKITKYLDLRKADRICKSLKYFSISDFVVPLAMEP